MTLSPVYILSSDEPLLKNDRSEAILRQARRTLPGAELMLMTHSDFAAGGGKANLTVLENELLDPGLFGTERLIKIYLNELNSTALQVLELIARRIRPGLLIIADLPRIPGSLGRARPLRPEAVSGRAGAEKVFGLLKNAGASVFIDYPPEGELLTRFVRERARRYSLRPDGDSADFLARSCEGNLTLIDQTLRILSLNGPDREIDLAEVDAVLSSDSRFSGFELGDAILEGDAERALNILNSAILAARSPDQPLLAALASLDQVLAAVAAARGRNLRSYAERAAFFAPLRIRSPRTMDAVLRASGTMPGALHRLLTAELNAASTALARFDTRGALSALKNMCAAAAGAGTAGLAPL